MNFNDMKDIAITVIASGAVFSFIQYLLNRHDNKKNVEKKLGGKIDGISEEVKAVKSELSKEIKGVSDRLEEHRAVLARTHILRFADELTIRKHSKEYFGQQLQDIKTYETYCDEHPDFQNEMAKLSIKFIREEYERLYLTHDQSD